MGQPSTRQLKAGLECGWPEETHQDNNQKKRLYEGTLDQNYPNISEFRIYLDRVKSNLTLFSPQVLKRKNALRDTVSPIMPVQVEPVEALLLTVHMGAWLMVVMVAVLLATVTSTISGKKRPHH